MPAKVFEVYAAWSALSNKPAETSNEARAASPPHLVDTILKTRSNVAKSCEESTSPGWEDVWFGSTRRSVLVPEADFEEWA
jgi:hypothetical protein